MIHHRIASPARFAASNRSAILLLFVLASGCRSTHYLGILTQGDDKLVDGATSITRTSEALVLLRSPADNSLQVAVSPPKHWRLRTSNLLDEYDIAMTITTANAIPNEAPDVFLPIALGPQMRVMNAWAIPASRSVVIRLSASRLGLRLFETALFSPGGITGVVDFRQAKVALPVDAVATRPEFRWATVWSDQRQPLGTYVLIRSDIEFPVIIDRLAVLVGGEQRVVDVGRLLPSHAHTWIRVGPPHLEYSWSSLSIQKRFIRTLN